MSARLANITIDCAQPLALVAFWSEVLGQPVGDGASEYFATIPYRGGGPSWFFAQVPEEKVAKNRVHIDLESDDVAADRDRLVQLGATHVDDKDEWGHQWSVMRDPEGNEFCISGPHA